MTKLSRSSARRRTFWTLLFLLFATVSMMGPTQAVSGVVSASVAVMETFKQLLDSPTQPAAAPVPRAQWVDGMLTPDFGEPLTPIPQPTELDDNALFSIAQAQASENAAVSQSAETSPSTPVSGTVGSGRPARRLGGLAALSPSGVRGFAGSALDTGAPADELALSEVAEPLSMADLTTTLSFEADSVGRGPVDDPGSDGAGSGSPFEPSATAPGAPSQQSSAPGSGADQDSDGTGSDSPFGPSAITPGAPLQSSAPGSGELTPGVGTHEQVPPSVNDLVPPLVTAELAEEFGLPPTSNQLPPGAANGGDAASSNDGFSLAQIPEPSTLLLVSLGVAAAARRRRRQRTC